VGVIAFTVASALRGLAPNIELLIGARILQGLAGATLVPLAMSMLMGSSGAFRNISPLAGMLLFLGPAFGPSPRQTAHRRLRVAVDLLHQPPRRAPGRARRPRHSREYRARATTERGESAGWEQPLSWLPLGSGALLSIAYAL